MIQIRNLRKKRILFVTTYPIAKIEHGGQKRALAIFSFYKRLFGEAKYIGVFHRGQYPEWGKDDILLGQQDVIKKIDENPYASELVAGRAIDNDIHVRSAFAKVLMEYKPDVIHLEQPYPYLGLKVLLAELDIRPKIIFGSQNIEHTLKKRIYFGLGVPEDLKKSLIEQTKMLEVELSKKADLVIAVNATDARAHRSMGAKKCIVIANGIDKTEPTKSAVRYWKDYLAKKKVQKPVIFVGSGHPPNWLGFLDLVGEDTSFMPPASKLFIIGGVAEYFKVEFADRKKYAPFWKNVELVGRLEEDKLAALLEQAELILLPIPRGGGSNLKTAEAILSGKKIVASPDAFHGFEKFRSLPNIRVADNKEEFKAAIIDLIGAPYIVLTSEQRSLAQKVRWEYYLAPLEKALRMAVFGRLPNHIGRFVKHKLKARL